MAGLTGLENRHCESNRSVFTSGFTGCGQLNGMQVIHAKQVPTTEPHPQLSLADSKQVFYD